MKYQLEVSDGVGVDGWIKIGYRVGDDGFIIWWDVDHLTIADGALQYFCDAEDVGGWIGSDGCVLMKEAWLNRAREDGSRVSSSHES